MDKHEVARIKGKVQTDRNWAVRGMLAVYKFQTEDEKHLRETVHNNKVGFNGVDAEILSSFSQQVLAGRAMSGKQMSIIFRKMGKYASQLYRIAYV